MLGNILEFINSNANTINTFSAAITALFTVIAASSVLAAFISIRSNNQIRKQELFLKLEDMSVDLFKFATEHPVVTKLYDVNPAIADLDLSKSFECLNEQENNIFQYASSLTNLFAVHFRLRRQNQVYPEIFACWMPWFYEACSGTYYQRIWETNLRKHYPPDFRAFMDILIETVKTGNDDSSFYKNAGNYMNCKVIKNLANSKIKR